MWTVNYAFSNFLYRVYKSSFNLLDVIYTYTDLCDIKYEITEKMLFFK